MDLLRLAICTCLCAVVSCEELQKSWVVHQKTVTGFRCAVPRPSSVEAKEFVEDKRFHVLGGIIPGSTVLHRCGSAGCCDAPRQCLPVRTTNVELTFMVKEGRSYKFRQFVAQNHTECGCGLSINRPK